MRTPITLRATLLASYRAARLRAGEAFTLNAASRAGQLLLEHGDAGRAATLEAGDDALGRQVRTYLLGVLLEERTVAATISTPHAGA